MVYNLKDSKRLSTALLFCASLLFSMLSCSVRKQSTTNNTINDQALTRKQNIVGDSINFNVLGTRSWIKLSWSQPRLLDHYKDFVVNWTDKSTRRHNTQAINIEKNSFYIHPVQPNRLYSLTVKANLSNGKGSKIIFSKNVSTDTSSILHKREANNLDIPSSTAVPEGMTLFFHDEFNDSLLNYNKWFDTYYSTLDYDNQVQRAAFLENKLPKAAYKLNGRYIDLFVNDSLPKTAFFRDGKKISSIQTYDWVTNTNHLQNERGGYYEVRVRRNYTGHPSGLNTAFWFDSPGPDLRYYYQKGTKIKGVSGIRPKGQLFEIDMFENMNAQFVMHGHVDSTGRFVHNLATDIAKGYKHRGSWVVHGLLWSPNSMKHFINGKLIHSYDDPHQIYSPDHFMNVLLGAYGKGGSVSLQVDYIRAYRWPINKNNELPNADFELNDDMLPWQGTATLNKEKKLAGNASVRLNPQDSLYQYVYVSAAKKYQLTFSTLGGHLISAEVNNVKEVTGAMTILAEGRFDLNSNKIKRNQLTFTTQNAPTGHTRTIRVLFRNTGRQPVYLDNLTLKRIR